MFETKEFKVGHHRFIGGSLGGVGTSVGALDLGVCFDIANGPQHILKFEHFFLTHAHSDHASGISYLVSQKALNAQKPPQIYAHHLIADKLAKILELWSELENFNYKYTLHPMRAGHAIHLTSEWSIKPFETVHRVPALGYTAWQSKKKLKAELVGLAPHEIAKLRKTGTVVDEFIEAPILSFTGDTQIEVLEKNPELLNSEILFIEVTFFDDSKPVSEAKKWGHIHFEEILPYLPKFKGKRIVFKHFSPRHNPKQMREIIQKYAPEFSEKIYLAPSLF